MNQANSRRAIPSVEKVLQALGASNLPRPLMLKVVRQRLASFRAENSIPEFDDILHSTRHDLNLLELTRIQPVINGTGIVIHTNFGRAPLASEAIEALRQIGSSYNNLEYDLSRAERGHRGSYVEQCLAELCASEAAAVVNNCAAALVLILHQFTRQRREVILVQIGGGFRIPDILEHSGATLREVGTTNKTSIRDYQAAICDQTALILKVHRSNFAMTGFVDSPTREQITALAHEHHLPFVEDLGSGAIAPEFVKSDTHEPTPAECIRAGVDLVCFSGDKLFGGPQAGIIAGKQQLVSALKKNQLFRALRCDKLILAALQATAELWLGSAAKLPVSSLFSLDISALRDRADKLLEQLGPLPLQVEIGSGAGEAGGGALPGLTLPSITIDLKPAHPPLDAFATRLRQGKTPVIGYISKDKFRLDLRTIFPEQDALLLTLIRDALG
jgi:L-seryl-tRNA(Ser) seleniumtransferase